MSVSVTRVGDDKGLNFAKGADITLKAKLQSLGASEEQLFQDLDSFAAEGLRTLVFAMRDLDSSQIEYEKANDQASSPVEGEYKMLGVTGVEDLL